MLGAVSGQNIIAHAWPVEIFLFASFLALIGWGTQKWGLMIPSGIVFGNALILAYCALTGRWGDWAFLWMLELLYYLAVSFHPGADRSNPERQDRVWARVFGLAMTILVPNMFIHQHSSLPLCLLLNQLFSWIGGLL